MMSGRECYTPIRPPRVLKGKVSKDTSGRLMNIIAELSVSKSNEDRQRKMRELKNDFQVSDNKLVQLISENREHLNLIMEAFSAISSKINTSRRGCLDVKEKLHACQKLLECKRDDIRRLWSESVEHHEVINMLKKIEDFSKVRDKVENYLLQEKFDDATDLLVSKILLLDGKLVNVDALKDVKSELNSLRENLHHVLVEELHKHLYMLPEGVFVQSLSLSKRENFMYEDAFKKKQTPHTELPVLGKSYNYEKDKKSNFFYEEFSILINCAYKLQRLSETVEILKHRCQTELIAIVQKTSELMSDIFLNSSYSVNHTVFSGTNSVENYFLLDLLHSVLNQFRYVAINHQTFLDNLQKIVMEEGLSDISYDIADVYSKIQATIELFVSAYIDFQNTAVTQRVSSATLAKVPTSADISSFFLRKDVNRSKKNVFLFKFDCSSHAISMKSYLEEKKESKEKSEKIDSGTDHFSLHSVLICPPMAKNITVFFIPLKEFIFELETALNMEGGTHCPLYTFLIDCVKLFLDEINLEVSRMIEKNIHRSFETWKCISDVEELKIAGAKTEILKSAVAVNASLIDMQELVKALPDFSSHFLMLVINILQTYKDLCHTCYKGLICPNTDEDKIIFSASWGRDQDICRLLRSLPNWTNLKVEHNEETATHEESPEDIRFRNKEESELLIRNLSCKDHVVSTCEIITDYKKLKNLALMHESMEYISSKVLDFSDTLPDIQTSVQSLVPEKFCDEETGYEIKVHRESGISNIKICLKNLAKQFADLADTCLLVLHLEVRAHCFFYLLPLSKQSTYANRKDDHEPEPDVLKLNADLCRIDEAISPVLQPKKMKYIFEGLGELLSTILINSVSNIKKINENGVKKMGRNIFAIQQNLAGITMTREVALDRARQYFDLLNHSFEDILNQIVEEGPQFQEQEYSAIIQLLHNSREGIDSLSNYREKLRQILDEVAVSV